MKRAVVVTVLLGVAAAAASPGAAENPVMVRYENHGSAPRNTSPALDEIDVKAETATIGRYDGSTWNKALYIVLELPPLPVYGFLAPGGSLQRKDMRFLNLSGVPTTRAAEFAFKPEEYDPQRGDLILLFWSETEGVATPWAEIYKEGDGSFKLREVPSTVPGDLEVSVLTRPDQTPKDPLPEHPLLKIPREGP
jgi:hypothetical protein